MARGRLTNDEFDELHGLAGEYLLARLRAWQAAKPDDKADLQLSPAEMAQVIKLLGENQINRPAYSGKKTRTTDRPPPSAEDEDDKVLNLFKR